MNFVDEKDGGFPEPAQVLRLLNDFLQVLDARRDGGKMDAGGSGRPCEDLRQGRLAAPGRAPKDEGFERAGARHFPKDFAGTQQMVLSSELIKSPRAHAVRQRLGHTLGFSRSCIEEIHKNMLS